MSSLGCCTLICTDKTGTLTLNQMTVANLWMFGQHFTSQEFKSVGATVKVKGNNFAGQVFKLLEIATLNSCVGLEVKPSNTEPQPTGDATELGLYRFFKQCIASRLEKDIEVFRSENPKVHEIPFNSSFKWQMSLHSLAGDGNNRQILFLKGAPDVLLTKMTNEKSSRLMNNYVVFTRNLTKNMVDKMNVYLALLCVICHAQLKKKCTRIPSTRSSCVKA